MTSLGTHLYSDSSLVPPSLFSVKGSDCVTSSSVGPSCFILLKSWTHSLPDKGLLCDLDRYQIQTNAHAGQMEISIMSSECTFLANLGAGFGGVGRTGTSCRDRRSCQDISHLEGIPNIAEMKGAKDWSLDDSSQTTGCIRITESIERQHLFL